ncbi:MAG TPA: UDP-N-acetylmuramoyl-L-alanyl-D-glutamate--2,6-diaminopimelate ligase [Candidatus Omnitrophota bacterium]|nr:UDP-N-acetylmuramoyl-L-alanyl-D-glutamate--2,6-diaminopimelate ligase [Candidatus Omnitrophota bacterium]
MRKRLDDLFRGIPALEKYHWDPKRIFNKITSDSRAIEPGDIFVACPGTRMDGHDFLGQAIYAKASVVVFEKEPEVTLPPHVIGVRVRDSRAAVAGLLNRYYDCPDQKIKLIGMTGTNGKTTSTYLLHRLLNERVPTAYLGTLWYELPSGKLPSLNTTPGPEVLIPMLHQMQQEGVKYCIMEVSSHAISQKRVYGLEFELGVFTQLTQDHLDYHHSMEHYFQTKRSFFAGAPAPRRMLFNKDCIYGRRLIEEWPTASTFSVLTEADYYVKNLKMNFQGSSFHIRYHDQEMPFQIRLPMRYNVANAMVILSAIDMLGFDLKDFRGALQEIPTIPGRMERIGTGHDFTVFVDYAHTPDAFQQVLHDARQMEPKKIITVFGCGGDRDRGKRPLMTRTACCYSDVVILTSDNPRSEDPEDIFRDMRKGLPHPLPSPGSVFEIQDRQEAIEKAISLAKSGDVVFVLGKGHEDYQILGDGKIPFSDREVVEVALKRRSRVFLS